MGSERGNISQDNAACNHRTAPSHSVVLWRRTGERPAREPGQAWLHCTALTVFQSEVSSLHPVVQMVNGRLRNVSSFPKVTQWGWDTDGEP